MACSMHNIGVWVEVVIEEEMWGGGKRGFPHTILLNNSCGKIEFVTYIRDDALLSTIFDKMTINHCIIDVTSH